MHPYDVSRRAQRTETKLLDPETIPDADSAFHFVDGDVRKELTGEQGPE